MVGIVIVSHSFRIAEGVAELAREMGGPDIGSRPRAGSTLPDHPIGTDAVLVMQAIERAWSDDGVLVLMDLGSAVLSAEMALDLLDRGTPRTDPALRGAARRRRRGGRRHREDGRLARRGRRRSPRRARGQGRPPRDRRSRRPWVAAADRPEGEAVVDCDRRRRTRTDCMRGRRRGSCRRRPLSTRWCRCANLTPGAGPADATSLNAWRRSGAATGHEIEVAATGPTGGRGDRSDARRSPSRGFDEEAGRPPDGRPRCPSPPVADDDRGDGRPPWLRGLAGHRHRPGAAVPRAGARRPGRRRGRRAAAEHRADSNGARETPRPTSNPA